MAESMYWLGVSSLQNQRRDGTPGTPGSAKILENDLDQWTPYRLTHEAEGSGDGLPDAGHVFESLAAMVEQGQQHGSKEGKREDEEETDDQEDQEDQVLHTTLSHFDGTTSLLVVPGYEFKVCTGGLLTNFHQPDSTLMFLVSAYLGSSAEALRIYKHAVQSGYVARCPAVAWCLVVSPFQAPRLHPPSTQESRDTTYQLHAYL